jgi:hypothetical protein
MEGVEPGEYSVTVGDTVKSDRKGKETFQVSLYKAYIFFARRVFPFSLNL